MNAVQTPVAMFKAIAFSEHCRAMASLAELHTLIDRIVHDLGFSWFALIHAVDLTQRPPPETLLLTTYPLPWLEEVGARKYYLEDPIHEASARSAAGLCWSRMADFIKPTARQAHILKRARTYGLRSGFTMPLRMRGEPEAVFSVARDSNVPLVTEELVAIRHIGLAAFERARTLLNDARGKNDTITLTPRQAECVTLVAEGKSDWDIGAILGISPETAGEYIDTARRKFGVQRRVQLVLRAANDGHLPSDVGLPTPGYPERDIRSLLVQIADLADTAATSRSVLAKSGTSPDSSVEMRTSLEHLPAAKQRELERVVQILLEEIADAAGEVGAHDAYRVLKILLYGSYARGGWVDEQHTAKGYQSDFDVLVIVDQDELTDRVAYWARAEERLIRELSVSKTLRTPVNFIVHSLTEVNEGLAQGRYFFLDVVRDGIALFETEESDLQTPAPKTRAQAYAMAQEYFDDWFPSATGRLDTARYVQKQGRLKEAAFDLHQTAERLYHCMLLVGTLYSPHVHNLAFLRKQAERLDRRLIHVWPQDRRSERATFEKLKDAYVKARYSKHYVITADELHWLTTQIEELARVVGIVCAERLSLLRNAINQSA